MGRLGRAWTGRLRRASARLGSRRLVEVWKLRSRSRTRERRRLRLGPEWRCLGPQWRCIGRWRLGWDARLRSEVGLRRQARLGSEAGLRRDG